MLITETQRLLIRQFHLTDRKALLQILGDPKVMEYSSGVMDEKGVKQWLKDCLENYAQRGYGLWAVVEKSSSEVIGYCGLTLFSDLDGRAEIEVGFRRARKFWGNGYATEAALAVKEYAISKLSLKRLVALIDPGNKKSVIVAKKLGMIHEKDFMLEGYTHPDHLYVFIKKTSEVSKTSEV